VSLGLWCARRRTNAEADGRSSDLRGPRPRSYGIRPQLSVGVRRHL